jgi:hypothetical protein
MTTSLRQVRMLNVIGKSKFGLLKRALRVRDCYDKQTLAG